MYGNTPIIFNTKMCAQTMSRQFGISLIGKMSQNATGKLPRTERKKKNIL